MPTPRASQRSRRRARVAAVLGVLTSFTAAWSAADEIPWSKDRRLGWADFTGPVDRRSAPENVAVTASALSWYYEYALESSGRDCRYRITNIAASATFDRDRSWSKPEHRTDAVLAHEQGHFDITQIYRLLFESLARDAIGATGTCDGGRHLEKRVTAAIEARVGPLYERVWQQHNATQQAYDRETAHGTDSRVQAEWRRRIEHALDGGLPGDFWPD